MAASFGLISGIGSLAGGAMGMFGGGGAQNVPQPTPAFQYPGLPQAAGGFQNLTGMQAGFAPQAYATEQNLYASPGAGVAQAAAQRGSEMGRQAAETQYGTGRGLIGQGMGAIPYAQEALAFGFDPQNQLYNRLFQQQTDQTRAGLEARGLDTTPYGAGVEAQSDIGFNTAWQQNLQARQALGAQTYGGLMQSGVGTMQTGLQDITGAGGQYAQAGFMPYQAGQTIGQGQYGAITGAQGAMQQPISNYLGYLGQGTQAAQAGTNQYIAALQAQNQQFNQNQAYGKAMGAGLQGIGNYFGGGTQSWGARNPGVAGSAYQGPVAPMMQ